MDIGLRGFVAAGLFAVTNLVLGCAQDVAPEDGVDPATLEAIDSESSLAPAGSTYTINCAGTIPGLPPPRCVPDLEFSPFTAIEVVKPGEELAPGTYLTFGFTNDSPKASGPFKVKVTDHQGTTLKTFSHGGLAGYASSSVAFIAPYACGWSRTVVLDSENLVDEDSEANNTKTYANWCARP
jgi:hypothetical protein